MRKELEDRLISFSAIIFNSSKLIGDNDFDRYLINQILRSSASSALNYGEAQAAESKKDFIHKISIVLKELRESNVNIKILQRTEIISDTQIIEKALEESNQLASIFYRTIQTAKKIYS